MGCGSSKKEKPAATLLDPIKLSGIELKNRVVMAAMTRGRCDPNTNIPSQLNATYYGQRASFGLILTECSAISKRGNGYYGSGAFFTEEQKNGWKLVVDEVHKNGGQIFIQIVHCGRVVSEEAIGGEKPLAPSAIAVAGKPPGGGDKDYPVPQEMTESDIQQVVAEFKQAAVSAIKVGFDGVELHGANGYLIDQFLRSKSNTRTDQYGGSAENRGRFLLEVLDAVIAGVGAGQVGIKLSPCGQYNDMKDENPVETYKYALGEITKRNIAFTEITVEDPGKQIPNGVLQTLVPFYKGTVIANSGFDEAKGNEIIAKGLAQLVSFAKLAITNPDLPLRFKNKKPVDASVDYSTMFFGGEKAYTDFKNAE